MTSTTLNYVFPEQIIIQINVQCIYKVLVLKMEICNVFPWIRHPWLFFDQIVNFCIPSHLVTWKPTSETTVDVKFKHGPGVLIYTAPNGPPVDLPFDSEGRYVYPAYLIRGDKIHSQEVHFGLLGSFLTPKPREWCVHC